MVTRATPVQQVTKTEGRLLVTLIYQADAPQTLLGGARIREWLAGLTLRDSEMSWELNAWESSELYSAASLAHPLLINAGGNIHEDTCQRGYFLIPSPHQAMGRYRNQKDLGWQPGPARGNTVTSISHSSSPIKQEWLYQLHLILRTILRLKWDNGC